jgi:methionyl-tRNA synthetase
VSEANRFVATRPWELAKAERGNDAGGAARLAAILGVLLEACRELARELHPFLPDAAVRIAHALEHGDPERGRTLFPKVETVP